MTSVPIWILTLQALLTPAIALAVGVIGFLQWRTAHQKFVMDTFTQRITIFREVRSIIDDAVLSKGEVDKEILARIHRLKQEATFLFGDDVMSKFHSLEIVIVQIEVSAVIGMSKKTLSQSKTKPKAFSEIVNKGELQSKAASLFDDLSDLMKPYMRMDQKRIRTPVQWVREKGWRRK